jgi:hypothetical protein
MRRYPNAPAGKPETASGFQGEQHLSNKVPGKPASIPEKW